MNMYTFHKSVALVIMSMQTIKKLTLVIKIQLFASKIKDSNKYYDLSGTENVKLHNIIMLTNYVLLD